jgi:hypothetical protein
MSSWQAEKEERNRRSLARLTKSLPAMFPPAVLARALGRPFIPPTPRLAIESESYWAAHPLRADRWRAPWPVAQALRKVGLGALVTVLEANYRAPSGRPTPYRERRYCLGPGFCCVCGPPVYKLGWHRDLWSAGLNKNAVWHCACVAAWQFWNAPNSEVGILRRLQRRRCGQTGGRLWKDAEIDHRVALFRVWRDHRDQEWSKLLGYWGLPNLQVINREVHVVKCALEARYRMSAD